MEPQRQGLAKEDSMHNRDPHVTPVKWAPRHDEKCRGCGLWFTPTADTSVGFCQICEDEPGDGANYVY